VLHEKKRAVALAPNDPHARVGYAEALLADGQKDDAVAELERALVLDASCRAALRLLAHTYVSQNRGVRAARALENHLEAAPDDVESRLALIDVHEAHQRMDDALLHVELGVAHAPTHAALRVRGAALAIARGLVERGEEHVRAARSLNVDPRELATLDDALAHIGGSRHVGAHGGNAELLRGRVLELLEDISLPAVAQAVRAADGHAAKRALLTMDATSSVGAPERALVHGEVALWLGEQDAARRAFVRAGEHPRALLRLGELALDDGDAVRAIDAFRRALARTPDDAHALEGLGDALLVVDEAKALEAYERAALRAPLGAAVAKRSRLRARLAPRAAGQIFGLAWSPEGGSASALEGVTVAGSGRVLVTGNVRDVVREAAEVAWTAVRARDVDAARAAAGRDLHLHFSEVGHAKDGPSAGLAFALLALSALTERPLRAGLAATGELTPGGVVKPVGGIHEKVVAAFLAGVRCVLLPAQNASAVAALPRELRGRIELVLVDTLAEARTHALLPQQ
jgi:ATP-dependent Lon protease